MAQTQVHNRYQKVGQCHVTFGSDTSLLVLTVRDHYNSQISAVAFFDSKEQVRTLSTALAALAEEMPDAS